SASPGPIWWTRRSEKRWTGLVRRARTALLPVYSVGVWQYAQPVLWKRARPAVMEAAPPGRVRDGLGGARNRMKKVNFSMALIVSAGVAPSGSVVSFGVRANWQFDVSSRSCGNSSLVIPISTL